MALALNLMKRVCVSSLSVGVNVGILSVATTLNMSPNEMIDVHTNAKRGSLSVLNVDANASVFDEVIKALVGKLHDLSEGCEKVMEKVDQLRWHASMLKQMELHSAEFDVAGLSNNVKVMLSIALCIGCVAGLDVAVIVVRKLLRDLQRNHHVSTEQLGDAHVESAVRELYNNLRSGGDTLYLERQCEIYDSQSGLKWQWQHGHRYRQNITEALVCLAQWAFRCTHVPKNSSAASGNEHESVHQGSAPAASASTYKRWATRSAKVHKACFMLEKMGWNVQATGISENPEAGNIGCLFLETGTDLGLEFMEVVKGEGNAPKQLRGNGGGVTIPINQLEALVGAALSLNTSCAQDNVQAAWKLGVEKGKQCKIVRDVHQDQCTYALSFPQEKADPEAPEFKWAAKMLVKTVGSKASEFAEEFHQICKASQKDYEELGRSGVDCWDVESNATAGITLGYVIGFIYGEIYNLVDDLQLTAYFGKIFISWLDSPAEFASQMLATLVPAEQENEKENALSFTKVCRVIAAAYCGDATSVLDAHDAQKQQNIYNCVGMLTRRGLLLMTGVLDPIADFWHCSNAMLLPHWPLNLVGQDIYVCSANKYFGSDFGIGHVFATSPNLFKSEVHVTPPSTSMSIGCSPNLRDRPGTNMHCMFADGHLMYCGPIMATIASLCDKVAPCKCTSYSDTAKRKNTCTRSDVFVVTDRDLVEERMYVSETYKSLLDRTIDVEQPPEPINTNSKGIVLVHDNLKWAYAAASVYFETGFLLAGSCLSCAVDQSEHIVIQCGLLSHQEKK